MGWPNIIYEGNRKLYPPDSDRDAWVISENEVWIPGAYENEEAARKAFEFDDAVLRKLQDSVNPGGIITLEMLESVKEG